VINASFIELLDAAADGSLPLWGKLYIHAMTALTRLD